MFYSLGYAISGKINHEIAFLKNSSNSLRCASVAKKKVQIAIIVKVKINPFLDAKKSKRFFFKEPFSLSEKDFLAIVMMGLELKK